MSVFTLHHHPLRHAPARPHRPLSALFGRARRIAARVADGAVDSPVLHTTARPRAHWRPVIDDDGRRRLAASWHREL
ncbi:hypothetical protein [Streptomyces orinoci]|uniref:Uncharacterized protein n=1 Tax=Streptomyces orinoci TaxID=67339 RepID=A0ABV3K268_STRON|nr:hypothetical protein [Streptomyces orinoci]